MWVSDWAVIVPLKRRVVRGIAQPLRRETENLIGNLRVEAIDDSRNLGGVRYKRQMRPVLLKCRDGIYYYRVVSGHLL